MHLHPVPHLPFSGPTVKIGPLPVVLTHAESVYRSSPKFRSGRAVVAPWRVRASGSSSRARAGPAKPKAVAQRAADLPSSETVQAFFDEHPEAPAAGFQIEDLLEWSGVEIPRRENGAVNWPRFGRPSLSRLTSDLEARGLHKLRRTNDEGIRLVVWVLDAPPPQEEAMPIPRPAPAPARTADTPSRAPTEPTQGGKVTLSLNQIEGPVGDLVSLLTANGWQVSFGAQ